MNGKYAFIRKLMQRKGWSPPKMHSQITQQLTPTVITVISGFCNLGTYWCCSCIVTLNVPNAKITGHWFGCASAVLVLCPAVGLLPCQLIFSPQPGYCHVRIVFQRWEKHLGFLLCWRLCLCSLTVHFLTLVRT